MVVRHGHVVAEGWWAPYAAERPHLLYSLTKSFTSVAVGLAVTDGLLSLDDRVVDVLPDHVPAGIPAQGRRLTVHHLLSMTSGHGTDSLAEAWCRQLQIGGRLVAPVKSATSDAQSLHVVDRVAEDDWSLAVLDSVRFVPLRAGTSR